MFHLFASGPRETGNLPSLCEDDRLYTWLILHVIVHTVALIQPLIIEW